MVGWQLVTVAGCLVSRSRRCLNLKVSRNNAVQRNTLDAAASAQMGVDMILKLSERVCSDECIFLLP